MKIQKKYKFVDSQRDFLEWVLDNKSSRLDRIELSRIEGGLRDNGYTGYERQKTYNEVRDNFLQE